MNTNSGARAGQLAAAKQVVLAYYRDLDALLAHGKADDVVGCLDRHTVGESYRWRGVHPFYEQQGTRAVAEGFFRPLMAFRPMQRRPDVFFAGYNDVHDNPLGPDSGKEIDGDTVWVCQMGHLLGLFDEPWLDIPPNRKMCFLRYAEFHRVIQHADGAGSIAETALFIDVVSVMAQAGVYPLPPPTGASHIHPGPRTHDGILLDDQDPTASATTMTLVNRMIADLIEANATAEETGANAMPAEILRRCWHDDMIWSGPEGIGATYTIDRYQEQHQYPFRFGLADKTFNGHIARIAEGNYAGFFGWSNLTNRAIGGFLGLPASATAGDMRVVDIYRREGEKLAENWVFIDLLHWLSMQGLDVLARMRRQLGLENFGHAGDGR